MLWISRGIPCSSELWEQIYGGKGRLKLSETKHPFRDSSGWRTWTQISTKFSAKLEAVCSKQGKRNPDSVLGISCPLPKESKTALKDALIFFPTHPRNDCWIQWQSPPKEMSGGKSLGLALTPHCC